jgi:tRNA-(ms[2]io[6]A)-hydroxylase
MTTASQLDLELKTASSDGWLTLVLDQFDEFLPDHAANERKASTMAMSMLAHYPDRLVLVNAMVDLALEELNHFRQVLKLIHARGLKLTADEKDPYVNQLRQHLRRETEEYFLDRLLCGAVIEARGAERFSLIAENIDGKDLARFYDTLARSERQHQQLFLELAECYFDTALIRKRLGFWQEQEARVIAAIPLRARLH